MAKGIVAKPALSVQQMLHICHNGHSWHNPLIYIIILSTSATFSQGKRMFHGAVWSGSGVESICVGIMSAR